MYLTYYKLRAEPFSVTPDPEFLYMSAGHSEALASLIYGVEQRRWFITIVGEVGTGKTILVRAFLARANRNVVKPIYLFNPYLSYTELLRQMLNQPRSVRPASLLSQIQRGLVAQYRKGSNVVLIIDEAQHLPVATLEKFRILSNLETTKDKLLQVVLVGQPELDQKLKLRELRQLKQRIAIRASTRALTRREGIAYVRHRLARASEASDSIFERDAIRRIVESARGNPRTINMLCDNALIAGYGYLQKPITLGIVDEVINDFIQHDDPSLVRKLGAMMAPASGFRFDTA